jgi:DivIVA domain-containing protein
MSLVPYVVFVLAAVAVLVLVAVVATGKGGGLARLPDEVPDFALPEGDLTPDFVDRVRLGVALRGYRTDQVDDLLDRVSAELAARDTTIAELRAQVAAALPRRSAGGPAE